jgi:hypothetical protein
MRAYSPHERAHLECIDSRVGYLRSRLRELSRAELTGHVSHVLGAEIGAIQRCPGLKTGYILKIGDRAVKIAGKTALTPQAQFRKAMIEQASLVTNTLSAVAWDVVAQALLIVAESGD